jgi:hypothetical protein
MERDWESTFRNWSKPSSDTEQQQSDNAVGMIKTAIGESPALSGRNIKVFPQGSYRNNTNVRQNSDVDVCVLCFDTFYYELPSDGSMTRDSLGIIPATYEYVVYKNEVEAALVAKFGSRSVERGHKAFDVHENSYRVEADVVACFQHRLYMWNNGKADYLSGVELRPDNGGRIINWPDQHYENGVTKNDSTSGRFKFMTRVIKRLKNEMVEINILEAKPIESYLIECLVWNTPKNYFGNTEYIEDIRNILIHTFNETLSNDTCHEWVEVNGIKYLFHTTQSWTREQAHAFLGAAWNYIGFK